MAIKLRALIDKIINILFLFTIPYIKPISDASINVSARAIVFPSFIHNYISKVKVQFSKFYQHILL